MEASTLEMAKNIIQVFFTPIMLVIILGYQYFKIRNLKDQLAGHDRVLGSIQTYFEILDPDVLKYRVELYEKTVEKQMKIDLEKMESKLKTRLNKTETARIQHLKTLVSASKALSASFVFVPHSQRIRIFNEMMEDEFLKGIFKDILESYKQTDIKIKNVAAHYLLGGEKPSIGGKRLIGGEGPT